MSNAIRRAASAASLSASVFLSACGSLPTFNLPGISLPTLKWPGVPDPPSDSAETGGAPASTSAGQQSARSAEPPAPSRAVEDLPGRRPAARPEVRPEPTAAQLRAVPDAVPRREPLADWANRPYSIFGRQYTPMTRREPYSARGVASWYGRPFHGRKTANGETYNMYGMTAAHPTLPLPSYARVTNLNTGKSVIVRVNDRGPFLGDRAIDLSYTAALKLGYAHDGLAEVEITVIEQIDRNLGGR